MVEKVAMSQDARYIVTVGSENRPLIKIWEWTYGNQEPDGKFTLEVMFFIYRHCLEPELSYDFVEGFLQCSKHFRNL